MMRLEDLSLSPAPELPIRSLGHSCRRKSPKPFSDDMQEAPGASVWKLSMRAFIPHVVSVSEFMHARTHANIQAFVHASSYTHTRAHACLHVRVHALWDSGYRYRTDVHIHAIISLQGIGTASRTPLVHAVLVTHVARLQSRPYDVSCVSWCRLRG